MVFEFLSQGKGSALSTAELLRLTGLPTARALQAQIARERRRGLPILSACGGRGGYFRPAPGRAGEQEILEFCKTVRSRAMNTMKLLRILEAAARLPAEEAEGLKSLGVEKCRGDAAAQRFCRG